MAVEDPFKLQRFLEPQARCIEQVCRELRNGRKASHWMWFIFPQLKGLGQSAMSNLYGIASIEEAREYLAHPVLGTRLSLCTSLVLEVAGKTAAQIFGEPDDLKFRSSMTLFSEAADGNDIFEKALEKYFNGKPDLLTIERLRS